MSGLDYMNSDYSVDLLNSYKCYALLFYDLSNYMHLRGIISKQYTILKTAKSEKANKNSFNN